MYAFINLNIFKVFEYLTKIYSIVTYTVPFIQIDEVTATGINGSRNLFRVGQDQDFCAGNGFSHLETSEQPVIFLIIVRHVGVEPYLAVITCHIERSRA